MLRIAFPVCLAVLIAACEREPAKAPPAPSKNVPSATPAISGVSADKTEKTEEKSQEQVKKVVEDYSEVVKSTFSLEKLKEITGSLSTEDLTQLADRLPLCSAT